MSGAHFETIVYMVLAGFGTLVRVILKGVWTWRTFIVSAASAGLAIPAAWLLIWWTGLDETAPLPVNGGIFTLSGIFALTIFERVEALHLSWTGGGLTVETGDSPDGARLDAPANMPQDAPPG